jgi:hypothetical protein
MNSDINLLEEELKLLDEKLSHLEHSNKLEIMDHKQFIDNLIAQFQVIFKLFILFYLFNVSSNKKQ